MGTEQGGILPVMFGVSVEWKRIKEQTPHLLKKPLHVLMMECILQELAARVKRTVQDETARSMAIKADWLTEAVCFTIQVALRGDKAAEKFH